PLFHEPIEAWIHGPVVAELYRSFKQHGSEPLPPANVDHNKFMAEEIELLDEMWEMFGQFSATKLRNMTHSELPWKKTPTGAVIPRDLMKEYFRTQLVKTEA
ncbi:MAG TPA: type II toxin-antitoxin system antitoxin SocA domain-containing protein, partial [Candidatus Angelobacter sp.]